MNKQHKRLLKKRRAAERDIVAAFRRAGIAIKNSSRQLKHSDRSPVEVDVGALLILCDDIDGAMMDLGHALDDASGDLGGLCDTLSAGDFNTSTRRTLRIDDVVAGHLLYQCLNPQFNQIAYRLCAYERLKKEIEDLLEAVECRWTNSLQDVRAKGAEALENGAVERNGRGGDKFISAARSHDRAARKARLLRDDDPRASRELSTPSAPS